MTAQTLTAADVLAKHRATWDMPTLCEDAAVLEFLSSRWTVDFDLVGNVVVVDNATGAPRFFQTYDVREALATLLSEIA